MYCTMDMPCLKFLRSQLSTVFFDRFLLSLLSLLCCLFVAQFFMSENKKLKLLLSAC